MLKKKFTDAPYLHALDIRDITFVYIYGFYKDQLIIMCNMRYFNQYYCTFEFTRNILHNHVIRKHSTTEMQF